MLPIETQSTLGSALPSPGKAVAQQPHRLSGTRTLLALGLARLLRLWSATLQFEIADAHREVLGRRDRALIFALWHNRLFIAAEMQRRYRAGRPLHALVSASKDGAWLAALFHFAGIATVRGSSKRAGREAVATLLDVLRAGHDIGITPDGPRGPRYECKPGALVVARRAGVPMVLLGAAFEDSWQLPSWDLLFVPKPFSRVRLIVREIDDVNILPEPRLDALREELVRLNPDDLETYPVAV